MATLTTTELSFSTTTDEEKAKAAAAGQIVFVEPSEDGGTGKIYMGGKKFGGGGSDTPCEDEKMPASTTSNKAIMLPIGTDISGLSALDILKKILMATYMPYFRAASASAAATYACNEGDTAISSDYLICSRTQNDDNSFAYRSIDVTCTIKMTGTPASAVSSATGSSSAITYSASGGDMSGVSIDNVAFSIADIKDGSDKLTEVQKRSLIFNSSKPNELTYGAVQEVVADDGNTKTYPRVTKSISINGVGAHTSDNFATVNSVTMAAGATQVKDSSGKATNLTASAYNSETGTANSGISSTTYKINSKTVPVNTSFSKTLYGYLPIYFQQAMEFDGTPSTSTPSGAAPAGSSGTILALWKNGAVSDSKQPSHAQTYNTETNANGYYYKVKMPAATSTIPWQVLVPDGYNISSFYIKNVGGNWESTTSAMLSKTSTTYTIHGYTYNLWQGALGASKQPVAFKIKKG